MEILFVLKSVSFILSVDEKIVNKKTVLKSYCFFLINQMLRRFNRNCNLASCSCIIRQCSTTASAADKSTTTTKTPNFQSYKAFENMDELRNKLTDKMSTIQKEEHMERENLGLNSGQSMADPIWYETHFGDSYKKKNGKCVKK